MTFQCNEGYVPSAVMTAICNEYGMWVPAPEKHNCTFVEGMKSGLTL